jgi:23S rRNA (uracil1939-C5)-methyltransferase
MAFLPTDFTQVNFKLNQKMVLLVIDLLELNKGDEVIDFFCSLDNFNTVLFSATTTSICGT